MRVADIKQAVKEFLDPQLGSGALPLEIRAAVLDAIEKKVTVLGVKRRVFPYDRIIVRLLAPAAADRVPLEKVFAELESRVRERLREIRCEIPRALEIRVSFMKKAPPEWAPAQMFSIDYGTRADGAGGSAAPSWPMVKVTVLKGTATKKVYTFQEPVILIGRTAVARDTKGRVRANHVAFDDRASTVSRAHATVKYDKTRAEYRIFDEGSARGTHVIHGDRATMVQPRDPRGVRVRSGDELQFGDALVRVTID